MRGQQVEHEIKENDDEIDKEDEFCKGNLTIRTRESDTCKRKPKLIH
jgi:hypothetical protein